jgi:molybdenum cofactor cytidylyltransferase
MGEIWAIILAAGESKRMGSPKMLLDFNGSTMIENVINNVKGSDVNSILVVLGANSDILIELVAGYSVNYCYNDSYKDGMLSSVKCGIRNLPQDIEAVLIFQGDQPFIYPDVINKVIGSYRNSDKGIVIPVCNNKRGHPLLLDRKYTAEIEKLDDREGLRSLAHIFSDDVLEIQTGDDGILRDFDTYQEYIANNQII